ncbi:MAG: glycosyltransferase [Chloroflexi bacterium]|nr:glycosyltransferase [Chloroflexota bacterium]
MKVIYSFNKKGFEADYWTREIAAASTTECQFIPFNHGPYLNPNLYVRAQLLDNLYYQEHPGLTWMYEDITRKIHEVGVDVLLVDTCPPYHPEFLRKLDIYKVLRIADGPMSAYDRDFAYLHAYDHVLYHSPAYSRDMGMEEKLLYCGAKRVDFWPLASFDALCDPSKTELDLLSAQRDIDMVFIGALHVNKMPLIAAVKKALRRRFRLHGLTSLKKNVYFNLKYGFPGWVTPLPFTHYVPLYQRAKIGINVHNRGDYTVGSYRLFDLPANGVMQISDGGQYLEHFFSVGEEVVSYRDVDELIDKVKYYLAYDEERERIALNGFRRVRKDYKIAELLKKAGDLIKKGMEQRDFK